MRLCEETIYIRLATRRDLLDDGRILEVLDLIASSSGERFQTLRTLGRGGRVMAVSSGQASGYLDEVTGGGLHRSERFRMEAGESSGLRQAEFQAFSHPYTGVHVTSLDVRWSRAWVAAGSVERLVALFGRLVEMTEPISAHSHDTDDNSAQQVGESSLLREGYGIAVETVDLAANPGREVNLGESRCVVNWLTWLGGEELARAGRTESDGWPVPATRLAGGVMFRLDESPLSPRDPETRERQRALRSALGYDRIGREERRAMGYWQRKA